jgi:membrane-associated phospholipid phosphatase
MLHYRVRGAVKTPSWLVSMAGQRFTIVYTVSSWALLLSLVGAPSPLAAQGPVLGISPDRRDITTKEGLVAVGGVAAVVLLDRPLRHFLQAHRSRELDGLADVMRHLGEPQIYGGVAGGMLLSGLIANDEDVKRAAGRLILAEVVTLLSDQVLKKVVGRARPDASESPFDFDPFHNKQVSFVSGHTAMAFTLATSLADDIEETWATVPLYLFATGTAWSRLNDDRHWPSDVVGGAALGYLVAKMAGDRWEVFGLTTPRFLQDRP